HGRLDAPIAWTAAYRGPGDGSAGLLRHASACLLALDPTVAQGDILGRAGRRCSNETERHSGRDHSPMHSHEALVKGRNGTPFVAMRLISFITGARPIALPKAARQERAVRAGFRRTPGQCPAI